MLVSLKSRLSIPIVTPSELDCESTERLKNVGVHAVGPYPAPFSTQTFWNTLRTCLPLLSKAEGNDGSTVSRLTRIRNPRIVIMDNEEGPRQSLHICISKGSKGWYKNATVLLFDDVEEALRELEREPPDLFTTDYLHLKLGGSAELHLLRDRMVLYPIFVISAYANNEMVLRNAGPDLNVTLICKPFGLRTLRAEFEKYLGPSDQWDTLNPKDTR